MLCMTAARKVRDLQDDKATEGEGGWRTTFGLLLSSHGCRNAI